MKHVDFVSAWNEGKILIDVDRSKALQISNSKLLPKRYQVAHRFWCWVCILTIPAAIAVGVLFKWWVGLIIIVFVTPTIASATKKSAMQFMIDYAIEKPDFFQFAVTEGVIMIRQNL